MSAQAGLLPDLPAAEYHADPCPSPSLSSSIAHVLLTRSPRHAWWRHPRLNRAYEREEAEQFDLGTAAHAYVLQGVETFEVIDAPDWRKDATKALRDAARAAGKVPLLSHQWTAVRAMEATLQSQLAAVEAPRPFRAGDPEVTLVWREGAVWCRARPDWLHADLRVIDDLKTTGMSAEPGAWSRSLFGAGYDLQAAFYLRGLRAVCGANALFRFVVVENTAPYAVSLVSLTPQALALADRKVSRAIELWGHCLDTNEWPSYPTRVCYAEAPAWAETQWLEREVREAAVIDDGRPLADQLLGERA